MKNRVSFCCCWRAPSLSLSLLSSPWQQPLQACRMWNWLQDFLSVVNLAIHLRISWEKLRKTAITVVRLTPRWWAGVRRRAPGHCQLLRPLDNKWKQNNRTTPPPPPKQLKKIFLIKSASSHFLCNFGCVCVCVLALVSTVDIKSCKPIQKLLFVKVEAYDGFEALPQAMGNYKTAFYWGRTIRRMDCQLLCVVSVRLRPFPVFATQDSLTGNENRVF